MSTAWARRSTACSPAGRPFQSEDLESVLLAVQNGKFPPPRELDPRIDSDARGRVPEGHGASSPSDRYASARALADDVERWMADDPVTALPKAGDAASLAGRAGIARQPGRRPPRWS